MTLPAALQIVLHCRVWSRAGEAMVPLRPRYTSARTLLERFADIAQFAVSDQLVWSKPVTNSVCLPRGLPI